jgi:hypothetical protein
MKYIKPSVFAEGFFVFMKFDVLLHMMLVIVFVFGFIYNLKLIL